MQCFEELSTLLSEMADDVLIGTFTNSLDPVIIMDVFAMRTVGLENMMDATQLDEKKLEMARASQGPYAKEGKPSQKQGAKVLENPTIKIVTLAERVPTHSPTMITLQGVTSGSGVRRENTFRRWTDSEL